MTTTEPRTITHHPAGLSGAASVEELWTCGNADLLEQIPGAIAVVGSRAATTYGAEAAQSFAATLTMYGHTLVTGGSVGIEVAATRGALAAGGTPIIVLPCGLARADRAAHSELFDAVVQAGGFMRWLAPADANPSRARFAQRSAWIGAHSAATLVIEAAARSGALAVAEAAATHGRAVAAVPGPISSAGALGAHRLIEQGAEIVYDAGSLTEFARLAREARGQ